MTAMIDFRACNGLHADTMDFFKPVDGAIFSCNPTDSDPPDVVVFSNPLDAPISLNVIDVQVLFRDAPDDLVEVLFTRQWCDDNGTPFRMAEPCLDTGETLFRGYTTAYPLTEMAAEALAYLDRNAERYSVLVTLKGGEEIAVDNRRQMVRFSGRPTVERRFSWTTHLGDNHPVLEEQDHARV